ncbi:caspase family protein [Streptomyces sp. NPDC005828]|uniref:HD domain-containing protein n=1 Tax=Streptomyces sp. NPDC005828 TaxID=3157071 RepID=UPI003405BDF4
MSSTTDAARHAGEGPAGRLRALLIGVGRTEVLERHPVLAGLYPPLRCVDGDVRRIDEALTASDYEVTSFHPGHPRPEHRDTSRDMITQALEDFLGSCAPGDTALVYVSSHGVVIDGRDYVLPSSARHRADGTLNPRTLIETTVTELLYEVPPGVTVVVCLDACRTDVPGTLRKRDKALVGEEYENVVWLRASSHGESAFADPEKGSYFGLALSEALSSSRPPKTLGEVHGFVQGRIRWLTARLDGPPPTVELLAPAGREAWARELPLCRGSEETVRWAKVVDESALWTHTSGTADVHERVKESLRDLAAEVARSRIDTKATLATPWHDPAYPERVVHLLGRLVEGARLDPAERLSPAETAALLAAPLLHEGIVAIAMSELAALRPDRLDRWDESRGEDPADEDERLVCDAAADICRAHSRVNLAAETLRRRRLPDAATAADHWLRHRFIADWDRLWERSGGYPAVVPLLDRVVKAVSAGAEGTSPQPHVVDQHVRRVLPHMTVAPGSGPRVNDSGNPGWSRVERPVPGNSWRDKELAYLLWLAALLAADPRRMSSVLVDHLGAHEPLAPAEVVATLAGSGWESIVREGTTAYALRLACPHPALHAALEELAATAESSVRSLHQYWHAEGRTAPDLLRGVPRRVTTEFLEPVDRRYTKPLERFRLAEDEIRPLLMGTQLYGNRMLAVRELYQNALDACRYRRLRVEYGHEQQRFHGSDRAPEIHFLQAYDGDRAYIECRDEGAGMSREKLTSMFARAGKRYEQDPDYVQERRNWRRVGMKPVPFNSRFGIGVFSYFMLAEEIVVSTAAIDQHGNPSRAFAPLQATVQSGSGLLQIRETEGGPDLGGTVVRLYLSAEEDEEDPPSVVETLRRLLWVSEFRVTAEERGRDGSRIRSEVWEPGVLRAPGARALGWHGEPVRAGDSSWIVQGPGQLLLDGILVEGARPVHGYVFNLRERHRPVPSVNRNSLITYDTKAVEQELLDSVPEAARSLDAMSMRWLWSLANSESRLVVQLFDHASSDTVGYVDPHTIEHRLASDPVPLRRMGVLGLDANFLDNVHEARNWPSGGPAEIALLRRWRSTVLGMTPEGGAPFSPEGYPEPIGLDALLFSYGAFLSPWSSPLTAAAKAEVPLARSLRALRRYAIAGVHVPGVRSIPELREAGTPSRRMADLLKTYTQASMTVSSSGSPPAAHAPLIAVAAQYDVPPSRLLDDLDALVRIGVDLPDTSELRSADLDVKPTDNEVQLLAAPYPDGETWHEGHLEPSELIARVHLPRERRSFAELITALRPLGFALSESVTEATLDLRGLSPAQKKLISRDVDGVGPWLPAGHLTMWQLLDRGAGAARPLGEVAEEINALTPVTGVSAPDVPPTCRSWIPPLWLYRQKYGGPVIYRPIPDEAYRGGWRLVVGAHQAELRPSPEELRRDLTRLDECGVLSAPVDAYMEQFGRLSPILMALLDHVFPDFPQEEDPWGFNPGEVRLPLLLRLATRQHVTLGSVVDDLARANARLPLCLPDLTEQARSLRPVMAETERLIDEPEAGKRTFKSRLTPQDLLTLAKERRCTLGEAAGALGAYRCIGGPAVPGTVTETLSRLEPTDFDLTAFDRGLLGPGLLGPLELVRVAGRFGWTLGAAYDRYAPFESLGLEVAVPEPKGEEREIIPGWRDVIVLTEQLTGRAPAVSGTVTDEHVVLCAEETEQSEDDVRDSLVRYARLFSLDVPASGGPRP